MYFIFYVCYICVIKVSKKYLWEINDEKHTHFPDLFCKIISYTKLICTIDVQIQHLIKKLQHCFKTVKQLYLFNNSSTLAYSFHQLCITIHQIQNSWTQLIKDLKSIKYRFFSSEKKRNSGNYIYNYAHSLFGEDF